VNCVALTDEIEPDTSVKSNPISVPLPIVIFVA
jgi:hypothetical protein